MYVVKEKRNAMAFFRFGREQFKGEGELCVCFDCYQDDNTFGFVCIQYSNHEHHTLHYTIFLLAQKAIKKATCTRRHL